MPLIDDPYFRVELLSAMPNPQQLVWAAMHQDYSENLVADERDRFPDETRAGELIVKHLLAGNRGHWGPIEHVQIVFSVGYYPHSVMQQLRTHRVGTSFDVQSFRWTGSHILRHCKLYEIEKVFYLRPIGEYINRQGQQFSYDQDMRIDDLVFCLNAAEHYADRVVSGMPEEQARGMIPFDVRQHFVMSCNARSLMHILDLRAKADAQLEIQDLCHRLMVHFKNWMPALADWYETNRWGKARLSP